MKIDTLYDPPFFKVSDTHSAATWLLHPDAPSVNPPEGIMNRRATFSKMNLAPSDELKVMDTADKDPAVLPHGKDPDIDSKITEKGGLL